MTSPGSAFEAVGDHRCRAMRCRHLLPLSLALLIQLTAGFQGVHQRGIRGPAKLRRGQGKFNGGARPWGTGGVGGVDCGIERVRRRRATGGRAMAIDSADDREASSGSGHADVSSAAGVGAAGAGAGAEAIVEAEATPAGDVLAEEISEAERRRARRREDGRRVAILSVLSVGISLAAKYREKLGRLASKWSDLGEGKHLPAAYTAKHAGVRLVVGLGPFSYRHQRTHPPYTTHR